MTNETNKDKHRVNAWITLKNYDKLEDYIANNTFLTKKFTKGFIIDIGLNLFFKAVENDSLENVVFKSVGVDE